MVVRKITNFGGNKTTETFTQNMVLIFAKMWWFYEFGVIYYLFVTQNGGNFHQNWWELVLSPLNIVELNIFNLNPPNFDGKNTVHIPEPPYIGGNLTFFVSFNCQMLLGIKYQLQANIIEYRWKLNTTI